MISVTDNNSNEYTIEEAAQLCIDEWHSPDIYFPSAKGRYQPGNGIHT